MVAYLCLLAAIFAEYAPSVIAFDEPDAHLHPSALRRLVQLLERAAEHTSVLVATHSDRFLDHLSDPAASLRICEPVRTAWSSEKRTRTRYSRFGVQGHDHVTADAL